MRRSWDAGGGGPGRACVEREHLDGVSASAAGSNDFFSDPGLSKNQPDFILAGPPESRGMHWPTWRHGPRSSSAPPLSLRKKTAASESQQRGHPAGGEIRAVRPTQQRCWRGWLWNLSGRRGPRRKFIPEAPYSKASSRVMWHGLRYRHFASLSDRNRPCL